MKKGRERKPKRWRILIVEDDLIVQKVFDAALRDRYDLMLVNDAHKALEVMFLNGESFDLIILDIVMPIMDGIELLKRIREVNPWIPVLIVTAHSSHERAKDACNLNVAGYVEKPFDILEFQEIVNRLVCNTEIKGPLPSLVNPKINIGKNPDLFHPISARSIYEIHKRFHTNFSIEDIAAICSVSKHHLCKLFKTDCGMTIGDYTNKLRIEAAKRLLQDSNYTIARIQESLGYKSRTYFYNIFKEMTGVSPLEFRRISAGEDAGGEAD